MALTEGEVKELREMFMSAVRPVVLFDDDPDGLTSFLMLYSHVKDGKGIPVKNSPVVTADFVRIVNDYSPDLVVILDKPKVEQEFLDKVQAKVVWLDHHDVEKNKGVKYYNPRVHDPNEYTPTSYWMYKVMGGPLWIAMVGMIGDFFMPEEEIRQEFVRQYPDLLPQDVTTPDVAQDCTQLGYLYRIISFNLKGRAVDAVKSMKVMTRIKDPYEILEQKTVAGKFIYKKFERLERTFQELLKNAPEPKGRLLVYKYAGPPNSFSKEISNFLSHKYPNHVVIVAWEYEGEMKCSHRSAKYDLIKIINKALVGVDGYAGGHPHAAGGCIKTKDFDKYIDNIRKQL